MGLIFVISFLGAFRHWFQFWTRWRTSRAVSGGSLIVNARIISSNVILKAGEDIQPSRAETGLSKPRMLLLRRRWEYGIIVPSVPIHEKQMLRRVARWSWIEPKYILITITRADENDLSIVMLCSSDNDRVVRPSSVASQIFNIIIPVCKTIHIRIKFRMTIQPVGEFGANLLFGQSEKSSNGREKTISIPCNFTNSIKKSKGIQPLR